MKTKKEQVKQRRKPSQKRSKITYNSILEVSPRLLIELGYENTTTDRIAEKAGVSIGTLYEYFSDKDHIFQEWVNYKMQIALREMKTKEIFIDCDNKIRFRQDPLSTIFDAGLSFATQHKAELNALRDVLPRALNSGITEKTEEEIKELCQTLKIKHLDKPISFYVISRSYFGFLFFHVLDSRHNFSHEELKNEFHTLMGAFLPDT